MDRRHLEAFVAVAEERHFGRAARRLHLSQPAVTQAIRGLEEEVGVLLLERTRRSVTLTVAGTRFLKRAREALAQMDLAAVEARRAACGELGSLTIAFTGGLSLCALPEVIAGFKRKHPGVALVLEPLGTPAQLDALAAGRCDLGCTFLAPSPPRSRGLELSELGCEPLVAVLPEVHPLARRARVSFAELADDPVLLLSRRSEPALWRFYGAMSGQFDLASRVALEVDHLDAMLTLVASGLGVSFAPNSVARFHPEGVCFVPLAPLVTITTWLMWSQVNANPALKLFLAVLGAGTAVH